MIFVIVYYFYELGFPGIPTHRRPAPRRRSQQVTSVERGYNLFEANCARCHGATGQGGIGPVLNDQAKLYAHLNPDYIKNVLTVGGRYVCGNPQSLMPVWADTNGGPLNYVQIQDLIAFIRAPNDPTYTIRDTSTNEPILDRVGQGRDRPSAGATRTSSPAANATPVPACWSSALTSSPAASSGPAVTPAPGATGRQARGPQHRLHRDEPDGAGQHGLRPPVQQPGRLGAPQRRDRRLDRQGRLHRRHLQRPGDQGLQVPALPAGSYTFHCAVHLNMTGTLTVK